MKDIEYIVYYVADKPDTVYAYYHKPLIGEQPYAAIFGYWIADDDNPNKRIFHECKQKRPMLMDYEHLMTKIIPDRKATKSFDSIDDFMGEEFLKNI